MLLTSSSIYVLSSSVSVLLSSAHVLSATCFSLIIIVDEEREIRVNMHYLIYYNKDKTAHAQ